MAGPLRRMMGVFLIVPVVLAASLDCGLGGDGINLSTPEGQELLRSATHQAPFWRLSLDFTTELPGFCGPASAVMMLNALGVPAPISNLFSKPEYNMTTHYWEQENVWDSPCVRRATKPYNGSLDQVASFVSCRGRDVQVVLANSSSAAHFRETLKEAFGGSGPRLAVVNFARHLVGQVPAIGHHSPVGAYDENSDRVLVMDVARYKYPPVWHCLPRLFHAMAYAEPEPLWNMSTARGWWTADVVAPAPASGAGAANFLRV